MAGTAPAVRLSPLDDLDRPSAPWPAGRRPLVVDLSSLWAGPLCGRLLRSAGARVVKVEGANRPDGARFGPPSFFALMNDGKEQVVVDLRTTAGIGELRKLLCAADVVIEASRPRALEQLGLDARSLAGESSARAWVAITGYGQSPPEREWVAFGDDAAAAGGLVVWDDEGPCFCADAVADPLTGLLAATAASIVLATGGRRLIDVALARTAAAVAGPRRHQGDLRSPRSVLRDAPLRDDPLLPDRPGIVHAVSAALLAADANIVENAQFGDEPSRVFCMRTRFETDLASVDDVRSFLAPVADQFGGDLTVRAEATVPRVLIMVSTVTCRCCPRSCARGSPAGSSTSTIRSCRGSRRSHSRRTIAADYAVIGRDVERMVLARAVRYPATSPTPDVTTRRGVRSGPGTPSRRRTARSRRRTGVREAR